MDESFLSNLGQYSYEIGDELDMGKFKVPSTGGGIIIPIRE